MSTMCPHSLHINNVANVAYGNAKILHRSGQPVTVACHDISHLMSQPEWDDLALNPADFPDETNFYSHSADLSGYQRPAWFKSDRSIDPMATPQLARPNPLRQWAQRLPPAVRHRIAPAYHRAVDLLRSFKTGSSGEVAALDARLEQRIADLVKAAAALGRDWRIDERALRRYVPQSQWLRNYADSADVLFAYYLSPVYAMLLGNKPLISVDIGTMRELPRGSSPLAQLLWLAYRSSDHIVLTNPDTRSLAEQGGIERYSFCPHPIDEQIFHAGREDELRTELLARYRTQHLLFAPARQNWQIKGNDKMIRAFARLRGSGVDATLIVPAWGQEVDRSKALARSLDVAAHIDWCLPMSEPLLARHYRAVDLVLDQFQLGVFGLITPKAMACGTPVLTSYESSHNAWCFPVAPPLVRCSSEADIHQAMQSLLTNAEKRREIGAASRRWIDEHHSGAAVLARLNEAMQQAIQHFGFSHKQRFAHGVGA